MFSVKRFAAAGAIAATFAIYSVLQPCPAKADDEGGVFGDLTVSEVAATPARAGETTIVTFSVENAGDERVLITGLRLPGEEPSRVMGSFGPGQSGEIGTLPVGAGATASLDGRKVWVEVGPLARDLEPETTVPARLVLGSFESPLTLHVGLVATGSIGSRDPVAARTADQASAQPRTRTGC
ncbi:hypothetical protein ACFOYU_05840 [Microvirga sp. GCM10011540]|uniref:hypothetical protein n=1 Tax=Microvirga sp. GCM10011540 TaxID=3317338 RepID=UPI0036127CEF